jgi:hexosaminidase
MKLFPGTYIHVGGDEVDASMWAKCKDCAHPERRGMKDYNALQSVFMQRIEKQLIANNRRLIGWDEIIEGGLSPTAAVTSWRGIQGGIAAAKSGHFAVMSPNKPLYLDHGQSYSSSEPPHWPGRETLEEIYNYEPIPAALTAAESGYILYDQPAAPRNPGLSPPLQRCGSRLVKPGKASIYRFCGTPKCPQSTPACGRHQLLG